MAWSINPVSFAKTIPVKAIGVVALQVIEKDTGVTVTDGVFVNWEEVNGQIKINFISGLKNSTKYTIRVLVL